MTRAIALGALLLAGPVVGSAQPTYDLILRRGTVVDGTGAPLRRADIAVRDGRIVLVGTLPTGARASTDLDVRGLLVAPGFLNIHSHAEPRALSTAVNMLQMGVTTEIVNADGGGPVDLAQQVASWAGQGLAVNVGGMIGFNSVWAQVVGPSDRRPVPEELRRMRVLIGQGMTDGAWGVSAGLDYKPGYYATADEVVQVVDTARHWRTIFSNHDRLRPETGFSSRLGIAETIDIATRAGLMPVVTHMKVQGREQGTAAAVLASMQADTRAGRPVAADAYPYLAGQTSLAALLIPAWAQDGGAAAFRQRLADPATRARIVTETDSTLAARFGGVSGVYLPESQQPLAKVVADSGATSPGDAIVRLVAMDSPSAILTFGSEADLVRILQHPATSMACDCGASLNPRQHPRFWGSYPRVLGHYVRDTRALTWPEAIRKMTALPAATIGLTDRGRIAEGLQADLVVFDSATIRDHATYEEPTRPSEGVVHVVVNGQLAFRDRAPTGVQAGRVLRRAPTARSGLTAVVTDPDTDTATVTIMRRLATLAADSMEGRRAGSPGAARARRWIIGELAAMGAQPVAAAGFEMPIALRPRGGGTDTVGANIVARIPGRQPGGPQLVVSAHYDHLGVRNGQIYNGADDDASGCIALLTLGERLLRDRPDHDVLLVFFDGEEIGLQGSKAFVATPPIDLATVALDISLDMIARQDGNALWVSGTSHYPALRPIAEAAAQQATIPIRFGHDTKTLPPGDDWTNSSDHGSFHARGVPFLYLGVEDHPDYHQPGDDADRIDSRFFRGTVDFAVALTRQADRSLSALLALRRTAPTR